MSLVFLICFFYLNNARAPIYNNYWIVWNVGQGQWVSQIKTDECLHFDAGGEYLYYKLIHKKIILNCGNKLNRIFLSHWDFDHYSFIIHLARYLPQICWQSKPLLTRNIYWANKVNQLNIKKCSPEYFIKEPLTQWAPIWSKKSNDSSQVYLYQSTLMMGDLPQKQEVAFINEMSSIQLQKINVLILGHHGSKTSTSLPLLQKLPSLYFAIASARFLKYKHPHHDTLKRLYSFNIPLLKTEDWGNIWFND